LTVEYDDASPAAPNTSNVFWPQDLLPEDCLRAQIWTWGYDTKVTKGYEAANHNSLFAHARNLLFALKRKREIGRPLVFVTHSLGGIIGKEVSSPKFPSPLAESDHLTSIALVIGLATF
jgi:hypothetical protein